MSSSMASARVDRQAEVTPHNWTDYALVYKGPA